MSIYMKLFKGKSMKILIIVALMFQLMTTLWADQSYTEYVKMKKEAYALYDNDKTEDAFIVVKEFLRKHPQSTRAQNLLAVLYFWNGDITQSKKLLQTILVKENFPQALALLKRIEKKEGRALNRPSKAATKSVVKKSERKISTSNLTYLINKIKKDPNDALSRKILALHYEKIGNTKQANYFARSVLRIDPDDNEMASLLKSENVSPYTSKSTVKRALRKLDELYAAKSYNRFMNLYSALENNNVVMPTSTHVNALYSAISLQQYEKAKSILHIYRMPKSKYLAEIEVLIDEKLMMSRFAQSCTAEVCGTSR